MKRALVTGGSGAIGAAIAKALAQAGHHTIVHANTNPGRAEAVAADIRAFGSAETATFDVSDEAASRNAIEALLETGPIQCYRGLHMCTRELNDTTQSVCVVRFSSSRVIIHPSKPPVASLQGPRPWNKN